MKGVTVEPGVAEAPDFGEGPIHYQRTLAHDHKTLLRERGDSKNPRFLG